jgi:hypothetical protein
VKRDHITSHIRVHIPLKPHKCEHCGKSFKRPQDLKKHIKTHADDSVLASSPGVGPNRQQHHHQPPHPQQYAMQQQNPGYYHPVQQQPQASMQYGYQPPTSNPHYQQAQAGNPGYNVYSAGPGGYGMDVQHQSYSTKGGGYTALDGLFSNIKNRSFDPNDYGAVSQQLMPVQAQGLLPAPYGNMGQDPYAMHPAGPLAALTAGGNGGGVYGPQAHYAQQLPSLHSLRTKGDYEAADQMLGQMMSAIQEHHSNAAQAAASYQVATGMSMNAHGRNSNSPPHALNVPNSHNASISANSTPVLTPGSTVMSYGSAHSPTSSGHGMSPTTHSAGYPSLPGAQAMHGMEPNSSLGSQFDSDTRRRHSNALLQRAQTQNAAAAARNAEDVALIEALKSESNKGSLADRKSKKEKNPNIDPALANGMDGSSSPSSTSTTPTLTNNTITDPAALAQLTFVESLRKVIQDELEKLKGENGETEIKDEEMKDAEGKDDGNNSLYPDLGA